MMPKKGSPPSGPSHPHSTHPTTATMSHPNSSCYVWQWWRIATKQPHHINAQLKAAKNCWPRKQHTYAILACTRLLNNDLWYMSTLSHIILNEWPSTLAWVAMSIMLQNAYKANLYSSLQNLTKIILHWKLCVCFCESFGTASYLLFWYQQKIIRNSNRLETM